MKNRRRKNRDRVDRRTQRLAPLAEQHYASAAEPAEADNGVVRVTTGSLRIPAGISTEGKGAEPPGEWAVVIVIVAAACAFIAFITYLIATGQ